ncbi:hypothetical protein Tco_0995789, partial [Tanacetum coccineum]
KALWRVASSKFYGPDGGFGDAPDLFPRLFALESCKDCKISDRWICLDGIWSGNWAWRSPPHGRALDELSNLVSRIGNLTLDVNGIDKWSWADEASNIFNVKTLSKQIQNLSLNNFALEVDGIEVTDGYANHEGKEILEEHWKKAYCL